jgi:hypothetical protein
MTCMALYVTPAQAGVQAMLSTAPVFTGVTRRDSFRMPDQVRHDNNLPIYLSESAAMIGQPTAGG